jgi:lipoprotein-anchoring transpeptidase ErfK/SrfK
MSLPSQRGTFGSRVSSKRSRGRGGSGANRLAFAGVAAATLAGAIWLFSGGAGSADEPAVGLGAVSPAESLAADGFVESGVVVTRRDEVPVEPVGAGAAEPAPVAVPLAATVDRPAPAVPESPREQASPGVAALVDEAQRRLASEDLVGAREALNRALRHAEATDGDRALIRADMAVLNEDLVFSQKVYEGDPIASSYRIQPGDSLERIANNQGLGVDWRFIQRINRIADPNRIRLGQELKLVQGPMHAVVDKSDYRMDVFAGPPGVPEQWIFIRSFAVGLGENSSTPVGRFVVRPNSKLIDPDWRNPRTGEFFARSDPANPIGERWIGLEGTGEIAGVQGYGIHGTIDPGSIGSDASMGCIRLGDSDVQIVYEILEEPVSEVIVQP